MLQGKIGRSQWLKAIEYHERLIEMRQACKNPLGEACDPELKGILDQEPGQARLDFGWVNKIADINGPYDALLKEIIAGLPKPAPGEFTPITPDKLWLWGGPTPYWGGSMADDCLVREKALFGNENAVYVYGRTDDDMMQLHSCFRKLLCQVNSNCRTEGALHKSEEENAELLSRLSLKYPNIAGAMCDDLTSGAGAVPLPDRIEKICRGTKKYNELLKVYGVVYAHEVQFKAFDLIQPYIDVVNFWLWNKIEVINVDEYVGLCREKFPGKPILLGLFIHEYGSADVASPVELLIYQLERAGVMLKKGWIEGVVILGDREVRKWPKVAAALQKFLKKDQYAL